jgi:hypothetical protein
MLAKSLLLLASYNKNQYSIFFGFVNLFFMSLMCGKARSFLASLAEKIVRLWPSSGLISRHFCLAAGALGVKRNHAGLIRLRYWR